MDKSLPELFNTLPQIGRVEWLGVRPERKTPMLIAECVQLQAGRGIIGDRYNGRSGKRHVTLIQSEHITAIASFLGQNNLDPALFRRNVAISGINLLALKDKRFYIGDALLEYTGLCHPCSAMEVTFGAGGYNAMRGHGGITARILASGIVRLGDNISVEFVPPK